MNTRTESNKVEKESIKRFYKAQFMNRLEMVKENARLNRNFKFALENFD